MNVIPIDGKSRREWDAFVAAEFPPVGAFLQSFEWGDFKEKLHGTVSRFALVDGGAWVACFQLEIHRLPFGSSYGYAPRGPVLKKNIWDDDTKVNEIFSCIADYVKKSMPELIFVRFEPPHKKIFFCYDEPPFKACARQIQPRRNQLVSLAAPEELLKTFSADLRHDIRAAERLGISISDKERLSLEEERAFEAMKMQTGARSGKNIFPSAEYFKNLLSSLPGGASRSDAPPRMRFFVAADKNGAAVAINLNVLFAGTLTYLYGVSYTGTISKRAPAYLHWKTALYARDHGFRYYDLGGVDDRTWHGLTYFKRQFGGETLEYIGAVDVIIRPFAYKMYCFVRNLVRDFEKR